MSGNAGVSHRGVSARLSGYGCAVEVLCRA